MKTVVQSVFATLCLLVGAFSSFSLYKTGYIYKEHDIKDCKDLWFSILLSSLAFIVSGLYGISYLIWKCLCKVVCDEDQKGCGFTCFKFIVLVGIIAAFVWEAIHFVQQNKPCYQVYKNNYKLLWTCFYVQTIGIFSAIIVWLLANCVKFCCSNYYKKEKNRDHYERIV